MIIVKSKQNVKGRQEGEERGSDTARDEIVEEIDDLIRIPEIKKFLSTAVAEAKQKFQDQIQQYQKSRDDANLEKDKSQKEKEDTLSILNDLAQNKTFFFEFSRTGDLELESGAAWKLEKCKFKENEKIVNAVFSNFLEKLDQYEIAPNRIQTETVYASSPLGRFFQISFTKTSDSRVVGFVKEIEREEEKEEKFVLEDNINLLKVKDDPNLDNQEIYSRVIHVLEKYPEFTRYIYMYLLVAERTNSDYYYLK